MKERDHSEDQGVDGRMGLERILRIFWECAKWVDLAQDRDLLFWTPSSSGATKLVMN
jgi:hypothetical protein